MPMQVNYTSGDAFAAAVDAEWARTGDVTALMRAAHVAGLSYGVEPSVHIARIAMSGLLTDREASLVLSLLSTAGLEQKPPLLSRIGRHLAASPATADILAAMQANAATTQTCVQETLKAIRPSALDELKARMAPEEPAKERARAPRIPTPEPRSLW